MPKARCSTRHFKNPETPARALNRQETPSSGPTPSSLRFLSFLGLGTGVLRLHGLNDEGCNLVFVYAFHLSVLNQNVLVFVVLLSIISSVLGVLLFCLNMAKQ